MKASSYWTASSSSFTGHKDRLAMTLDGTIQEIPLGFQPSGINSRPLPGKGDQVIVADYFAPASCIFEARVRGHTLLLDKVSWIHGANNGITRCRGGFPDMLQPMGANRCMAVCFGPEEGTVWINRGEREFFVLASKAGAVTAQETRTNLTWELTRRVELPSADRFPFVFSAAFSSGLLHTIEAPSQLTDNWRSAAYEVSGAIKEVDIGMDRVPPWTRGVAFTNSGWVTVTDSLFPERERGIYNGIRRKVERVWGSGICALENGAVLLSRYGQEAGGPFKGIGGALVYVPPRFLREIDWKR